MTDDRPIRVVYMDDEHDAIELISAILSSRTDPNTGAALYTLYSAGNGRDAWALIKQLQPELVLLDLKMVDSWEVYEHFRGSDETSGIPVILITAAPVFELERLGLVRGRDFIIKPFGPHEFIEIVEEALRQSK